jgi:hypothetical protein
VSSEDPRTTLKNILKEVTVKKSDGSNASVGVLDEFSDTAVEKYDVTLTVGLVQASDKPLSLTMKPRLVKAVYRVGIWTRDKQGINGRTALWDAEREVRRVIAKYSLTPGGMLRFIRCAGSVERHLVSEVKPPVWHVDVLVETWRFES